MPICFDDQMRSISIGAACAFGLLALAGCASSGSSQPETSAVGTSASPKLGQAACEQFWVMVDKNENETLTVAESQSVSQQIAASATAAPTEIKTQALAATTDLDANWIAAYNGMIDACNSAGFTHP